MTTSLTSRARWLVLLAPVLALLLVLLLLADEPVGTPDLALLDAWVAPADAAPRETSGRPAPYRSHEPITLRGARKNARLALSSPDSESMPFDPAAEPSHPEDIAGVVIDESGLAVAGATVSLRSMLDARTPEDDLLLQVDTDARGAFRLAPVPKGLFAVWAEADDRAPAWQSGIAAGTRLELTLAAAGRLRVTALDADRRPVDGASIRVRRPGFFRDGVTDANGLADLAGLPAGPAELRIATKAGGLVTRLVRIDPDEPQSVTCTLAATSKVRGTVRERETANPIEGAVVRLVLTDHRDLAGPETRTDANGQFELLAPVAAGARLELRVEKDGFADGIAMLLVPVDSAADALVVITLWSERRVEGRVVDDEGRPVARARVWWPQEGTPDAAASTDARGRFRLALPAGAADHGIYSLAARAVSGAYGAAAIDLDASPDETLVIVRGSGRLVGSITDAAGRPASGALVALEPASSGGSGIAGSADEAWARRQALLSTSDDALRAVSDEGGVYRLASVPAGTWRIRVTHGAGSLTLPEALEVREGDATTFDVAIPGRTTIAGYVVSSDGSPVRGAHVLATSPAGSEAATSDARGRFTLDGLDGTLAWSLLASAKGYAPTRLTSVYAGGRGLQIALAGRPPVRGTVTLDGRAYAGRFTVRLLSARAVDTARGETIGSVPLPTGRVAGRNFENENGAFAVDLLDDRAYVVQAVSDDGLLVSVPRPAPVEGLADGESLELPLERASRAHGRITNGADAVVSLHAYVDGAVLAHPLASARADANGAFDLPPAPAGVYRLRVAGAEGRATQDIRLPDAGPLSITITNANANTP